MIEVTDNQVSEAIDKTVAEKGKGYIYTRPDGLQVTPEASLTCFYVHGDEAGCFVGNVLHRLGVSLPVLSDNEFVRATAVIAGLDIAGILRMSDKSNHLLQDIQFKQDKGYSWGDAVRYSRESQSIVD